MKRDEDADGRDLFRPMDIDAPMARRSWLLMTYISGTELLLNCLKAVDAGPRARIAFTVCPIGRQERGENRWQN